MKTFKEYCQHFCKQNGLTFVHTDEKTEYESKTTIKKGFTFFFVLKNENGVRIPASFHTTIDFWKPEDKNVFFEDKLPLPTYEIVTLWYSFTEYIKSFFEEEFKRMDKDRLREVTKGKVYQLKETNYYYKPGLDVKKIWEMINAPFPEMFQEIISEKIAKVLLTEKTEINTDLKTVAVYGKRGKEISLLLEEKNLVKRTIVEKDTILMEAQFPYELFGNRKYPSKIAEKLAEILNENNVACFPVYKDNEI